MPAPKTQFKTVDEYVATFPEAVQEILEKMRQIIREAAPGAAEAISYNMAGFKLNGKYLLYFAAFKKHIGIYPRSYAMEAFFGERLAPYSTNTSTIQFSLAEPIPYDFLKELAEFRVKEIEEAI